MLGDKQDKDNGVSRRNVIAALGTGAVGVGTSTVGAADPGDRLPNEERFKQQLAERYGEAPANATVGIARGFYARKESGELTQQEYHDRLTETLVDHPVAAVVGKDVRQSEREIRQMRKPEATTTAADSAAGQDQASISNANEIYISRVDKQLSTASGGKASVSYEYVDGSYIVDVLNIFARALIFGTASARVQFYETFTPSNSGEYNFSMEYFRKGKVTAGGTTFSIFRRDSSGSLNKKQIESVSSLVSGDTKRDATFTLQANEEYTVGFEVMTAASTAGGGGFSDFKEKKRRVDPYQDIPTLFWEYLG